MTAQEEAMHLESRARASLKAAHALFDLQDRDFYGAVLFDCHLAMELALKAFFIREKRADPPFTHDLNALASVLKKTLAPDEKKTLEEMTEYAILSRYGDEEWFASKATKENARAWIEKTDQLLSKFLPS